MGNERNKRPKKKKKFTKAQLRELASKGGQQSWSVQSLNRASFTVRKKKSNAF